MKYEYPKRSWGSAAAQQLLIAQPKTPQCGSQSQVIALGNGLLAECGKPEATATVAGEDKFVSICAPGWRHIIARLIRQSTGAAALQIGHPKVPISLTKAAV